MISKQAYKCLSYSFYKHFLLASSSKTSKQASERVKKKEKEGVKIIKNYMTSL